MSDRRFRLPPLPVLVAFESAARHASFKRAADELEVTPSAVSQHVKTLESDLGFALFLRHHRGVQLSDDGRELQQAIEHGLAEVASALQRLREGGRERPVTIAASSAVSALWLTPRLSRFWKSHGGVAIDQYITDTPPDRHQGHDLEIRYGEPACEEGEARVLFRDTLIAVAGPAFAAALPDSSLDTLARGPLIHLDAQLGWTDWPSWFTALGCSTPLVRGTRVNNYSIAVQSARDDTGLLLGWRGLVLPLIERGLLVQVGRHALPAPVPFHIRTPDGAPPREPARLLRDWLLDASDGSRAKAHRISQANR